MQKTILELAKELDFNSEIDYFNYIIESFVNGNKQQCIKLFNKLDRNNKVYFMTQFLDEESETDKRVKEILIIELI